MSRRKSVGVVQASPRASRTSASQLARLNRVLEIAGEVAQLLVHVRDKPKWYDWLAVATRTSNVALKAHQEFHRGDKMSAWDYFNQIPPDGVRWVRVNHVLRPIVASLVCGGIPLEDLRLLEGEAVEFGYVGDVPVAWSYRAASPANILQVYYKDGTDDALMDAVAALVWAALGSAQVRLTPKGLQEDLLPDSEHIIDTEFIDALSSRVQMFRAQGLVRGYLLDGPPGVGKSTAVQQVAHKLGLRSLRVDLDALAQDDAMPGHEDLAPSITTLVRVMKPDVVIFDDVDRVAIDDQALLLGMVEQMRLHCGLIVATINDRDKLLAALQRPGRFDDRFVVTGVTSAVLHRLVPPEIQTPQVMETMVGWPIAYVRDFVTRAEVLGAAQACAELDELAERVSYVGKEELTDV